MRFFWLIEIIKERMAGADLALALLGTFLVLLVMSLAFWFSRATIYSIQRNQWPCSNRAVSASCFVGSICVFSQEKPSPSFYFGYSTWFSSGSYDGQFRPSLDSSGCFWSKYFVFTVLCWADNWWPENIGRYSRSSGIY